MTQDDLLRLAKESAILAGAYLTQNKFKEKKVHLEKGRDIKLEVDRESEKIIRENLKKSNIPILGEEFGGVSNLTEQDCWIIDPLDGTSNYFRGLDQCCVAIALMNGPISKIGVIYNFNNDEMFSAQQGKGAYLNDELITVSKIDKTELASLTTGFPASENIASSASYLNDFSGWKKIRMFGSAALSCAYVASGKCDVYKEKGVYIWDFAAGICLVEEAGGTAAFNKIDEDRYQVNFTNGIL